MLSKLGEFTKFLRKSTMSAYQLRTDAIESGEEDRSRGPKGIGKTRFATHWSSAVSFEPHLRPLQRLIELHKVNVKVRINIYSYFRRLAHEISAQ